MGLRSKCKCLVALAAFLVFAAGSGGNEAANPDIRVEISDQKVLSIRVSIRSRSGTPVTFYKSLLPWGNRNSLILEAITPDGHCVQRFFAIDDPGFEKVTLNPTESLTGNINLRDYFKDIDGALKKSELQLFWAYKAPEELNIGRWSGGWILIPQQK